VPLHILLYKLNMLGVGICVIPKSLYSKFKSQLF
jgi:hypothetical protein